MAAEQRLGATLRSNGSERHVELERRGIVRALAAPRPCATPPASYSCSLPPQGADGVVELLGEKRRGKRTIRVKNEAGIEREHLVTHGKPVVIAPGGRKTIGSLSFKVRVETLNLERRGIRSKGQHTMLVVENTASS